MNEEQTKNSVAVPSIATQHVRETSLTRLISVALVVVFVPSALMSGVFYLAVKHLNEERIRDHEESSVRIKQLNEQIGELLTSQKASSAKLREFAAQREDLESRLKEAIESNGDASKEAEEIRKSLNEVTQNLEAEQLSKADLEQSIADLQSRVEDMKAKASTPPPAQQTPASDEDTEDHPEVISSASDGKPESQPSPSQNPVASEESDNESDFEKKMQEAIPKALAMLVGLAAPELAPLLAIIGIEGDLFGTEDVNKAARFKAFAEALAAGDSDKSKAALLDSVFVFESSNPAGTARKLITELTSDKVKSALDGRHGAGFAQSVVEDLSESQQMLESHPYLRRVGRQGARLILERVSDLLVRQRATIQEAKKLRENPPKNVTVNDWQQAIREYVQHVTQRSGLCIRKGALQPFVVKGTKRSVIRDELLQTSVASESSSAKK